MRDRVSIAPRSAIARRLKTIVAAVRVEFSAAPTAGDVLTATSATAAGWAAPAVGYAGSFDQAVVPNGSQIAVGKWGFWYDTISHQQFLVRNRAGVFRMVELTT